jgi:hypothetical protein
MVNNDIRAREDSDRVADLHLATFRGGDSRGRNVCQ